MASGLTATEILLFTESQATLRQLVAERPTLSAEAVFAIVNEDDCYRQWIRDVAGSRIEFARVMSRRLSRLFGGFVGPILASQALATLRTFRRSVEHTRFDSRLRMFSSFTFVTADLAHVSDDDELIPLNDLLIALARSIKLFGDFVVGSMNPTKMIDMALATDAVTIAGPEAIKRFNNQLENSISIPYILNSTEKDQVRREIGDDPFFRMTNPLRNDHAVMASLRHAIREVHSRQHGLHREGQGVKTLAVGAAFREVSEFAHLPNVHYYFANADSKDTARTSLTILRELVAQKRKNLNAKDRRVMTELKRHPKYQANMPVKEAMRILNQIKKERKMIGGSHVKVHLGYEQLLADFEMNGGKVHPGTFHFEVADYRKTKNPDDQFTLLLAQDWGYNATTANWLELFARTGAHQCFGYMALPLELLFDHMPESDIYRFRRFKRGLVFDAKWHCAPVDHASVLVQETYDKLTQSAKDRSLSVEWASLTHAYCNGYSHPVTTWGLLLRNPILWHPAYNFALEVQIENRFGPMASFSLTRIMGCASITRTIALPAHNHYVQLLDLPAMAKQMKQYLFKCNRSKLPLVYFSVHADEFYTTLGYAMALDIKSLTRTNLASFVKVHRAGASLVAKELKPKWHLKACDIYRFVQVVYYHALYLNTQLSNTIEEIATIDITWRDKLKHLLTTGINALFYATRWFWSWLVTENIVDKLVVVMPDALDQEGATGLRHTRNQISFNGRYDRTSFPNHAEYAADVAITNQFCDNKLMPDGYTIDEWLKEEEVIVRAVYRDQAHRVDPEMFTSAPLTDPDVKLLDKFKAGFRITDDVSFHAALRDYHNDVNAQHCECPMCADLVGKSGDQIVDCFYRADSDVTLEVGLEELNLLKEQLREEAKVAPSGLRDTLEAAMKEVPGFGISHKVRIEYIKGGPGTGKSRLIRELADSVRDLIVAPFQKLRVDYKDQAGPDGTLTSWEFHTQHRAMTIKNRERIFVDEFTGIPYALLAIIAYNCQAKTIVLVGDEQQTGVLEGNNEGTPIMKKVDLASVSMHNLLCNFRNPVQDVRKINYLYGTRMIPMSKVETGLTFGDIGTVAECVADRGYTLMHYSWETCRDLFGDVDKEKKTSVRCNQGSTHQKIVLPITERDKNLVHQDKLAFVAMSRHKEELHVLFDPLSNGPEIRAYKQRLTNFPPVVTQPDYVTRLAFGVEVSSVEPLYGFGNTTQRFIAIAKSTGGFAPAGVDPDAYTAIQDDVAVEDVERIVRRRVEELQKDRAAWCTANLLKQRENACLVQAVTQALGWSLDEMHTTLKGNLWYQRWVCDSTISSRADCENLAAALGIHLTVRFDGTNTAQSWVFAPTGATVKVVIHHQENSAGGHFYVPKQDVTEAIRATIGSVVSRLETEMVGADGYAEIMDDSPCDLLPRPDPTPSYETSTSVVTNITERALDTVGAVLGALPRFRVGSMTVASGSGVKEESVPLLSDASSFDFTGGAQVEPDQQLLYQQNFGLRQTFVDYATEFVPAVPVSYLMPTMQDFARMHRAVMRPIHPISDAYQLIKQYEFQSTEQYELPYVNHEMSNVIQEKFVAGMLNLEFLTPVNPRKHPKKQEAKFFSMGAGPALMYFQRNPAQQLQVLQARYLGRRARDLPSFKREKLARHVADLFVDECMEPALDATMTLENLYSITSKGFADMVKKHYQKQMDENDTRNARVYRFQLKDIEKPFKDAVVDLGKAGQGILAWSKEAHVLFMLAFRVLNDLLLKSLKPWVVYDNGMSEEQFLDKVNEAMAVTPDCAVNSVIDATACDSGQNGFTQMIERQIYARLGASELLLDWYFSFRERYILQSEHVRAPMENVKTSGEPGTLLGNSILMAAILNALVRGSGPFTLVMKGDDGFKRQANPKYDAELLMGIKGFCPLDFKIDIDVPITFCGYALVEGALYPDVQRKLAKVRTHRFHNYKHFAEYQVSLRDWLSRVPYDPSAYMKFLAVNAELSGRTVEQVEHMIMMIQSISHIGRKQFEDLFQQVVVTFDPPPHEFKDLDSSVAVQKMDTAFVPMDNYARRQMARIKYNLK